MCLTAQKLPAYDFTNGYEYGSWNNKVGYGKLNSDRALGIKDDITTNMSLVEGNYIRDEISVTNNCTLTFEEKSRFYLIKSAILAIDQGSYVNCEEEILLQGDNPYNTIEVHGELNLDDNNQIGVDITVKPGGTLTIPANKTVNLVNDASIIIENTGALVVGDNATITGDNDGNKLLVEGDLQTGNGATFTSSNPFNTWKGVELNSDASFINCDLSGDCKTLSISNSTFEDGGIIMTAENATISNSDFTNGGIEIFSPGSKHAPGVNISGCNITGILDVEAKGGIVVKDHPEFSLTSNSVTNNNCDGISIINSGIETGAHTISGNTISGNTGEYNVAGIRIYQSYAEIKENNIITNNENGIICLNNSNVRLEGFAEAQNVSETQQVMNNEENQVHASSNSFPVYFRYNAVIDEDNTMPLVYYRAQEEEHVDVAYNFWGNNFAPEEDFYPAELFDYEPVWELEYLQENPGPAEMLYADATQEMQTGNYNQAETKYKQVVQQYPASKFSKSALKVMLLLEELNNNNYNQLQNYYSNPQLQNNDVLKKLASRLSNNCDIKMENYPSAIAWFEDVIQDPETLEDSVFAIIDLENLYLMMEESGKSSYQGKMVEFIPECREAHHKHRAELLSLLGGEQTNAITAGPAERDVTATQLVTLEPNPFTNNTTINCQISKPAYVNISIYSLTGQKVLDVTDGYKEKGQYRFQVSAKHLPEGIYVYSLQVDGTIKERGKVVLVR
jgi:tetratricopeptide (TPR) repeat protein